jgi:hypothetical protein
MKDGTFEDRWETVKPGVVADYILQAICVHSHDGSKKQSVIFVLNEAMARINKKLSSEELIYLVKSLDEDDKLLLSYFQPYLDEPLSFVFTTENRVWLAGELLLSAAISVDHSWLFDIYYVLTFHPRDALSRLLVFLAPSEFENLFKFLEYYAQRWEIVSWFGEAYLIQAITNNNISNEIIYNCLHDTFVSLLSSKTSSDSNAEILPENGRDSMRAGRVLFDLFSRIFQTANTPSIKKRCEGLVWMLAEYLKSRSNRFHEYYISRPYALKKRPLFIQEVVKKVFGPKGSMDFRSKVPQAHY